MARLAPEVYEPRLKGALVCFRCGKTAKNMPALKKHLQDEFETLRKCQVAKSKKRKRESDVESDGEEHRMVDGSTNT
jgi:C2HE / C2H2 / C2HC zinc-binding finger